MSFPMSYGLRRTKMAVTWVIDPHLVCDMALDGTQRPQWY